MIIELRIIGESLPERLKPRAWRQDGELVTRGMIRTTSVQQWIENAHKQALAQRPESPYTGAVRVAYEFILPRPEYLNAKMFKWHCTRRSCKWEHGNKEPLRLNLAGSWQCPSCGQSTIIGPKRTPYHIIKPDLGNLEKTLQDALEGVLFVDDKQVIGVGVPGYTHGKRYAAIGEYPGVIIAVEFLEEEPAE